MKTPARPLAICLLSVCLAGSAGCDAQSSGMSGSPAPLVTSSYEVVHTFPHDPAAFTQGLVFLDGDLLESTGLNGQSTLRRVELSTGRILRQVRVPAEFFAEGLTVLGGKIYQLTWKNQKGFVYDLATFTLEKEFAYTGEGWGLTTDGQSLILSDGTPVVRFLDPRTFRERRRIRITAEGRPVSNLNEIEWVNGEIFGNIWQTNLIARIDPKTGAVKGWIDLTGLPETLRRRDSDAVANGIAYDAELDRLFVTGKYWPRLYEIDVKPKGVAR